MNHSDIDFCNTDLISGLYIDECSTRRQKLMDCMGSDSIAFICASSQSIRNHDSEYPFRQDSDFFYLTGFPEPEAILILIPGAGQASILFCSPRNDELELWIGSRIGQDGAVADYRMDCAFDIAEFDRRLPELIAGKKKIFYQIGRNPDFDLKIGSCIQQLRKQARKGLRTPESIVAADDYIHPMRMIKSQLELQLIHQAVNISTAAHRAAMQKCRPGLFEYHLEAELWHQFVGRGARHPAYNHIVGSGANACVLHYSDNNSRLVDGDLVLIDAGSEFHCYAADITRTFPVNGRFSEEQRAIYELVYLAQQAAIAKVRPGNDWQQVLDAAVDTLCLGLSELALLKGSADELSANKQWQRFFPHGIGHWLGLDVHDRGFYRDAADRHRFQPGMTLTIEPGIYIPADADDLDQCWRGIGVRIEDDVLVTGEGSQIISGSLPNKAADIEDLMRGD